MKDIVKQILEGTSKTANETRSPIFTALGLVLFFGSALRLGGCTDQYSNMIQQPTDTPSHNITYAGDPEWLRRMRINEAPRSDLHPYIEDRRLSGDN